MVLCVVLVAADGYTVTTPASKVVSEIKTYNWTSAKGWFEGGVTKTLVEQYDEEGRLLSAELYYQKMTLIEKTLYSYEGKLVKKTTTNHENILIRHSLIQKDGNTVTETVSRADGSLFFKTVSLLDNRGRTAEQKYYNEREELIFDKVYVYSENGDLEHIGLYNPDGTCAVEISIRYEKFDERGNWIVRSEYYSYADVTRRPRDRVCRSIVY
jgi:hypothetical protein